MYTFISMNASLLLGAYAKKDKKKIMLHHRSFGICELNFNNELYNDII